MGKDIDALATRLRRVRALDTENGQYERVKQVLWRTWDTQRRPPYVQVRVPFIQAHTENELLRRPAATRLLNPRGIAQRFYLLGLFEAQCRLTSGALFTKALPIDGEGDRDGWTDLIAVDTLYSSRSNSYGRRDVKQHRTPNTAKIRQIHSALTPLEKQGLAEVPRKNAHGHRDFERFTLMDEMGRGSHPTPRQYTTPDPRQKRFVGIPVNFFLEGWIHVLHPSEIATWLTLRFLRWQFPGEHEESRVFLYADTREKGFFLKRDAYEDGCAMLRDLGLIRQVQKAPDMEDTLYHPLPGWDRTWTASSVWPPPPSVDRRASRDRRLETAITVIERKIADLSVF